MTDETVTIYLCFEPDHEPCARRLDTWTVTNADFDAYNARREVSVEDAAAVPIQQGLRRQIRKADVTVCIIGQTTFLDAWIDWELQESKAGPKPNGLVGILLHEFDTPPPALTGCGATFVRFKQRLVEEAVALAAADPQSSTDDYIVED